MLVKLFYFESFQSHWRELQALAGLTGLSGHFAHHLLNRFSFPAGIRSYNRKIRGRLELISRAERERSGPRVLAAELSGKNECVLNRDQQKCVCLLAHSRLRVGLVQGPPGTGKTQTICEILRNLKFAHFPELISQSDCSLYRMRVRFDPGGVAYLDSDRCQCLGRLLKSV